MDEKKILIIEDEVPISNILKYNLTKKGYSVLTAFDGKDGLKKALKENPDLVLLDIMLPKMDGFEVCQEIRKTSNMPILMLTAKEDEVDKILGLELGADDYIKKPFSIRELLARIKTNIRRTNFVGLDSDLETLPVKNHSSETEYKVGEFTIDLDKIEIRKNGKPLEISLREYNVLKFFVDNPNKVFSRTELLEKFWGYEYYGDIRTVDVSMRRIREKVEDDPAIPKYIYTKRGVGYYFSLGNE